MFNVGDRVRCIKAVATHHVGVIGTVRKKQEGRTLQVIPDIEGYLQVIGNTLRYRADETFWSYPAGYEFELIDDSTQFIPEDWS